MGAVQFKVLGPLEAVRDDGRLGLGGRKPRAVLAALLLTDGRHVRTDALVDAVWGDAAPASAVKAVHKHVSFLRRQLGDPRLIVTRPDGYELAAAHVDRRRFEELVDEAPADREPGRQAARLAGALALWHGEPYPELGTCRRPWPNAGGWRSGGWPRSRRWPRPAWSWASTTTWWGGWSSSSPPTRCTSGCGASSWWPCTGRAARPTRWPPTGGCAPPWSSSWVLSRRPSCAGSRSGSWPSTRRWSRPAPGPAGSWPAWGRPAAPGTSRAS